MHITHRKWISPAWLRVALALFALAAFALWGSWNSLQRSSAKPEASASLHARTSAASAPQSGTASPVYPAGEGSEGQTPTADGLSDAAFEVVDGVKVFRLRTMQVAWEATPGKQVLGYGINGSIPGPTIRATVGDRVRIIVKNDLPEDTTLHWHGLNVPSDMDGVPGMSQDPIKPGESFTYEFTVNDAGTHWYHSHVNSAEQVGKGLFGAFLVEPRDASKRITADKEYTMVLHDGHHGYTINGKSYPANEKLRVMTGETVRVRVINAGNMTHPMHLHGHHFRVVAKDGSVLDHPYTANTLAVSAGETYDIVFVANNPGHWVFHCHVLAHAERREGMYGMNVDVIYEDALPPKVTVPHSGGH